MYAYNFNSDMNGRIEFYVLQTLKGSKQEDDFNPRSLSYTLGQSTKNVYLTGYGMGLFLTSDKKSRNYEAFLKVRYEGDSDFGSDQKTKAKLCIFLLPFKYLHKGLDFGDWEQPTSNGLYTDNLGKWQNIEGMNSKVSFDMAQL